MKKIRVFIVLIVTFLIVSPKLTFAQANSQMYDVYISEYVPCANDGVGEWVSGTVTVHEVKVKGKQHYQPAKNSYLVGEISGTIFRATGATNIIEIGSLDEQKLLHVVNNYHFVGPGVQFYIKGRTHYSYNANGELVAEFDVEDTICK